MAEIAVVNASPLIFLSKAGHLELLHSVADRILVPEPVAEEILVRGVSDISANAISEKDWIQVMPVPVVP